MTINPSTSILLALVAGTPLKADLLIVPGKRVGDVSLGMERAEVLHRLGTPQCEDVLENVANENSPNYFEPLHKLPVEKTRIGDEIGVLRDDWITSVPLDHEQSWPGNFVSFY